MVKQILGKTGLEVTALGFGAMEIRGTRIWDGRPVTDAQAKVILNAVVDAGINLIDTANDYGKSEEFIGKFLSHRRKEFYIATKCGCKVINAGNHDETPHEWTPENLMRCIDESLSRMKTDYVDLLQLHNPTVKECETNGCVETLQKIRTAGKTRFIGCSSTLPHIRRYIKWGIFDTFQIPYSALEREHEKVISQATESGAGTIIRGGVARGEPGIGLGTKDRWRRWEKANLDELREDGESRTQFMLRFTLTHPDVRTIIVGTLRTEHLQENIKAVQKGPFPPAVYAEAKKRLDRINKR